eukprot:TRINITY_DN13769_c0_g1_i1.p1 TRINITY_DN13769_c0_g1~~TRINITY_DN13769_c0_g1_i1.p1  ORF type:complete len:613 (+),score=209.49 TRINITY_DN13769_c0_g1_i1:145-1983(+)
MDDDFRIIRDDSRGKWAVVHNPTGAVILNLDTEVYNRVDVVSTQGLLAPGAGGGGGGGDARMYVLAVRTDGESLMLPIRSGGGAAGQEPNRMVSVEVLGSQEAVVLWYHQDETIGDMKNRLAGLCGIPPIEQALWVANARVDNDRLPVRESGIDARNAYVRVGRSGKLRVGVRTSAGACARVMALPSSTVAELKEMIARRINIPYHRQVLMLDGQELPNQASIRECGVFNGIELTVVPRSALAGSVPRFTPAVTPGRFGTAMIDGEPMNDEELHEAVDDVLTSVSTLVGQQAQLQRSLQHLVTSCHDSVPRRLDGSLAPRTPGAPGHTPHPHGCHPHGSTTPYPGAATHDVLSRARDLRMQAAAEADSALRLASYPPYPSMGDRDKASTPWNKHNILSHIAKEVRDFSEDGNASVANSLSRMERLRAEYDTLRHEMNLDTLRRALDPKCKLCGGGGGGEAKGGSAAAAAKPAAAAAAKTADKPPSAPATKTAASAPASASAAARSSTPPVASSTAARSSSVAAPSTSTAAAAAAARRASAPATDSRPLNPAAKPPVAMNLDSKPVKPSAPPAPSPAPKKNGGDDDSDESVMGDDVMGDPEAVEQWMRDRGRC